MDELRYDAGYRAALQQTISHLINRIDEEKSHTDLWLTPEELNAYIHALQDVKNYLQWILSKEKS